MKINQREKIRKSRIYTNSREAKQENQKEEFSRQSKQEKRADSDSQNQSANAKKPGNREDHFLQEELSTQPSVPVFVRQDEASGRIY